MTKSEKFIGRIIRHIRRTYKNKLLGLGLMTLSIIGAICTSEFELLIFPGLVGVLLLFTRENLTLF